MEAFKNLKGKRLKSEKYKGTKLDFLKNPDGKVLVSTPGFGTIVGVGVKAKTKEKAFELAKNRIDSAMKNKKYTPLSVGDMVRFNDKFWKRFYPGKYKVGFITPEGKLKLTNPKTKERLSETFYQGSVKKV